MAYNILRTSKYVRCFAGIARNVLNPPREVDNSLLNSPQVVQNVSLNVSRSLASQIASQQREYQNLERSLKKLDKDVRRVGRISPQELQEIIDELAVSKSLTIPQSLLVIRCCGNLVPEEKPEVRTKLVQEIWNWLLKLKVPLDISHYNALLRVYLENEHPFSPTDFLSELESKGIEPNRVTYQRLVSRYCQLGDIEGATRILEFMKEKQLPVNESIFNALIMGHSQCGDLESAEGIISVMKKTGIEASSETYTTLLCGFAKVGDIDSILRIHGTFESQEMHLLGNDYLEIAYSLGVNGHTEHIPQILSLLRKGYGYNQDAINVIYRLINADQDEAALLIHKSMVSSTREDGTSPGFGSFIIKQMVKANRPFEKILELCKKFEEEGLNNRALLLATEISLETANEDLAYAFIKELKTRGQEIRQHFFWPLLVAKAKEDPTGDAVVNVLLQMHNFDMSPNSETLRTYVLPNMQGKSSDIIGKLRQGNVSVGSCASNLVYSLLMKNDLQESAVLASRITAYYHPEFLRKPLNNALYKTKDYTSYVTVVRYIYENSDRREVVAEDKRISKEDISSFLVSDLASNKREFLNVIDNVVKGLLEEGLSINKRTAEKFVNLLGDRLTPELSDALDRLSSGDLILSPLARKPPVYTPSDQMNIPQLETLINNLESKGQDVFGLKRQLLTLYCRARELDKTEQLLANLQKTQFVFTSGVLAQLIELYTIHEKLDEAMNCYKKLEEMGEVVLDEFKLIGLAGLLIKNGEIKKGIDFLHQRTRNSVIDDKYPYSSQCWRILNVLAEQGKAEELNIVFNIFVDKQYIQVNNVMLGPLVKVHLVKNDIEQALETFENCCNVYKCTPFKNDLACRLIQKEDPEKLQKLTDLSTMVHGEINSLYDLVFSFVECGRVRQARKILETPGLQTRQRRIISACERYQTEGMIKPLEDLKDATKDMNHINRFDIYYQLLLSYVKEEDAEKAYGLWTQMQEEDITPTDDFLRILGTFLQKSNVKPPFVIPETLGSIVSEEEVKSKKSFARPRLDLSENVNEAKLLRESVKNKDLECALQIYNKMEPSSFTHSLFDISVMVELLVQENRFDEAFKVTEDVLKQNSFLVPRIFKFLLNKLATNGEIEKIKQLDKYLTLEHKRIISFDNRICHAHLVAGQVDKYLDNLEKRIDEATEEELRDVAENFPRGGALGILDKSPQHVEKFEKVAYKFAKRGIIAPLNVLWSFYFSEGQQEKAAVIWKDYLHNSPRLMFQKVLHKSRDTSDESLIRNLIDHLKTTDITPGALGNAYSCLLDIVFQRGDDQTTVSTFESVLKETNIENLNKTAIIRVKSAYETLGKSFDYSIPLKNKKSPSEDSKITRAYKLS